MQGFAKIQQKNAKTQKNDKKVVGRKKTFFSVP
jgi:hypothetical protein